VQPDPEMAATLLDQKEAGKMLLLITNRWGGGVGATSGAEGGGMVGVRATTHNVPGL
jgi:hypothetical protein